MRTKNVISVFHPHPRERLASVSRRGGSAFHRPHEVLQRDFPRAAAGGEHLPGTSGFILGIQLKGSWLCSILGVPKLLTGAKHRE